ncbi:MAG: DNA-binding response OmpR family regulator [Candidatus Poriferisodalaceae bacterium]
MAASGSSATPSPRYDPLGRIAGVLGHRSPAALASTFVKDVLLAADADWVIEEVAAALLGDDITVRLVRAGADVRGAVAVQTPDLVILDLQIGNMGGMATAIDLRHESLAGRLEHVPVLMLLDREADVFLAKRSNADAWLVKPIDSFGLRRSVDSLLAEAASAGQGG